MWARSTGYPPCCTVRRLVLGEGQRLFILAPMDKSRQSGFTLYELMIALAIVGMVLAFGVPNLRQYTMNSRMTTAANDLHSALHLARSEAPRAKTNITVCASSNATAADATCSGKNNWSDGFIVFEDTDGDAERDTGVDPEPVLRAHPALPDGITIDVTEKDNKDEEAAYFSFGPNGLGRTVGGNEPIAWALICDKRGNVTAAGGNSAARLLVVTPLGRAMIVRDKGIIGATLDEIDKPKCFVPDD